jgi:hypothetical protein
MNIVTTVASFRELNISPDPGSLPTRAAFMYSAVAATAFTIAFEIG